LTDFVTGVCRALAHPSRRALLQALARDECDVGSLSAGSGLDQPTASKHLAALRRAGLVQVRVDGRRRCYSLTHEEIVRPLLNLLTELGGQKAGQGPRGAASGDYPPAVDDVDENVLLPHV
jgi:DNA-binding transcriptional ArsR family regulator